KGPANRKQQAVEGHVILNLGMSDGPQKNCVAAAKQFERIRRHHATVSKIIIRPPIEHFASESKMKMIGKMLKHRNSGGNHFVAYAIAGNYRYRILFDFSVSHIASALLRCFGGKRKRFRVVTQRAQQESGWVASLSRTSSRRPFFYLPHQR